VLFGVYQSYKMALKLRNLRNKLPVCGAPIRKRAKSFKTTWRTWLDLVLQVCVSYNR
jgi:hypothetical protein